MSPIAPIEAGIFQVLVSSVTSTCHIRLESRAGTVTQMHSPLGDAVWQKLEVSTKMFGEPSVVSPTAVFSFVIERGLSPHVPVQVLHVIVATPPAVTETVPCA